MSAITPMQSRDRSSFLVLLWATLGAWNPGRADERPRWFVHRVLDCGSIRVTSDTKLLDRTDVLDPRGLSQRVRLTDMSTHRSVTLPIFQRMSRSRGSQGRNILDGLVWAFECTTHTQTASRSWLLAHLILALICDDVSQEVLESFL